MKYDVFISYSSKDSSSANRICSLCEENGIKCFLAERDIPSGQLWAPYIVDAIDASSVMVALFSANYNLSKEVDREITLASLRSMPILVYRIDMSEYKGAKKYYFSNVNWFSSSNAEKTGELSFIQNIRLLIKRDVSENNSPIVDDNIESSLIEPSILAAERGDTDAQFYLGRYYDEKNDSEKSVFWYRKAAKSGVAAACYNVSYAIFKKGIQEEYPQEGLINAEKAFNAGIQFAGIMLAWCYTYGKEVVQDYERGLHYITEYLDSSADEPLSLGMAYYLLGNYYRFGWGEIQKDIQKALFYWGKSAEYNNADAIYNLGVSFLNGDGVIKNESLAFKYFQRGIKLNDIRSYMGLALCYRRGINVEKDLNKAIELYKYASESGEPEAFACLGAIYLSNDGIPVNEMEAARWFHEGAQRGNATSQHYLGIMYFNGIGVPKNQAEGIKLIKLAAEKGNMDSIMALKKLGSFDST